MLPAPCSPSPLQLSSGVLVLRIDLERAPVEALRLGALALPLVQVGEAVQAGQVIATATPEDTPFGTVAFTELAVWLPADSDEEMIKMCPFLAFDADLKQSFSDAIYALASAWETHWGEDVFDEQGWSQPGCVRDQMTEAEARNPF